MNISCCQNSCFHLQVKHAMSRLSLQAALYFTVVIISTSNQVNSQNEITIIRGERDIFTNLAGCKNANAACLDKNCSYCQCKREKETYILSIRKHGECVANKNLTYVTCKYIYGNICANEWIFPRSKNGFHNDVKLRRISFWTDLPKKYFSLDLDL